MLTYYLDIICDKALAYSFLYMIQEFMRKSTSKNACNGVKDFLLGEM
jgi:hypothetical protein